VYLFHKKGKRWGRGEETKGISIYNRSWCTPLSIPQVFLALPNSTF